MTPRQQIWLTLRVRVHRLRRVNADLYAFVTEDHEHGWWHRSGMGGFDTDRPQHWRDCGRLFPKEKMQ